VDSSQAPEVRPLNPLHQITVSFRGRAKKARNPKKKVPRTPQGKVYLSAFVGKDIPDRIEAINGKLEKFYGQKVGPWLLIDRILRLGIMNADAAFEAIHKLEQQKETDKYGIQRHRPEGDLGNGGTCSPGSQQDNASSEGIQTDGECNSLCGAGLVEHESQDIWHDDKD
jgi:hypothetical protein